jgi:hypothetical protein
VSLSGEISDVTLEREIVLNTIDESQFSLPHFPPSTDFGGESVVESYLENSIRRQRGLRPKMIRMNLLIN